MFNIRCVFFTRNILQFDLTTFQCSRVPWATGHLPGQQRSSSSRSLVFKYLTRVPSFIPKHGGGRGGREKYPTTDKFTQLGRRRNLWGPAIAVEVDHTPALTIPNRKFTLRATDRSSFFKGGWKTPKPSQSPHPQWTGNHSPRVLDVRPAQKKKKKKRD